MKTRRLTLLAALGLLYVGIDGIFFDRIVGGDPLANIAKVLAILVGCVMSALGISLFVAALRGRSPATGMNSTHGKLLADAFCAAPSAFLCGFLLVRTVEQLDILNLTGMILFGVAVIFDLLWTHRELRRLAGSETAKRHATQFLWSCLVLSCLVFTTLFRGPGIAVSSLIWFGTNFVRVFGVVFWSAIAGLAIYPILRDAKRLADAVGPSQTTYANGRESK